MSLWYSLVIWEKERQKKNRHRHTGKLHALRRYLNSEIFLLFKNTRMLKCITTQFAQKSHIPNKLYFFEIAKNKNNRRKDVGGKNKQKQKSFHKTFFFTFNCQSTYLCLLVLIDYHSLFERNSWNSLFFVIIKYST